jgi:hypothetical protein
MPTRESLEQNRWLRPLARHLASPLVWRFHRRGVARGAALGLFVGFAIPVAQTPIAALFAVGARANLPVAALATFITNPLTTPFILYLAYRTGLMVVPAGQAPDAAAGRFEQGTAFVLNLAGPTLAGLLLFATLGAIAGFAAVHLGWRIRVTLRRRRRLRRRGRAAGPAAATGAAPPELAGPA